MRTPPSRVTSRTNKMQAVLLGVLAAMALSVSAAAAAGHSSNDVVSFGHSVTIPEGREVMGDVVVFGGNAYILGKVDGDAVVMGGTLHIAPQGEVDGETVAFGGGVDNQSTAPHTGRHHGGDETVEPSPPPDEPVTETTTEHPGAAWLWLLVSSALLSVVAFMLFPLRTRMALDDLALRPLVAAVVGFFWPVIFVVVLVTLAITIVGIPLMPIAVVALVLAYLLGRAAIAVMLGRRLFEVAKVLEPSPLATLLLGLLIITVVESAVPLALGIVLEGCLGAVAIGAVVLTLMRKRFPLNMPPAAPVYHQQPPFTPPAPPPPASPPVVQ